MNAHSLPVRHPRWRDTWRQTLSTWLSGLPRLAVRVAADHETFCAEVVTPRVGQPDALALENLLQSLLLSEREPVALEVWGTPVARRFLIRAASARGLVHVAAQLRAHIPQVEVRSLSGSGEMLPAPLLADPLRIGALEDVRAVELVPREGSHLPLKLYDDRQLSQTGVDPVLGVLAAMTGLPDGCRVVAQLALAPASEAWSRAVQRLAVEHPLAQERAREAVQAQASRDGGTWTSGLPIFPLLVLLALITLTRRVIVWYAMRDLPHLIRAALVAAVVVAVACGIAGLRARRHSAVYSMRLVEERTLRIAARTRLPLAAMGPVAGRPATGPIANDQRGRLAPDPAGALATVLDQLIAAYRQHALASGNGLAVRPVARRRATLLFERWGRWARKSRHLFTVRELAALWHLPASDAAVPLLERTRAKRLLAPAIALTSGYRLGTSEAGGHTVPVRLPADVLRRNALLVAKTGKGKSSLLQHLALARLNLDEDANSAGRTATLVASSPPPTAAARHIRSGLVVVDPHGDLVRGLLPLVPAQRRDDAILVDLADTAYPIALNPLDALLGRDRDKAVESLLAILSQIWSKFWGPRMQNALEYALKSLYEANEVLVAADSHDGPDRQYTLLDVAPLLTTPSFRKEVLASVGDLTLRSWWKHYYDALDPRLRTEIINPVLTKMAAFSGSRVARRVVGQSRSTLDLAAIVREGRVLLVNTARGVVGAETATLVGATLLGTLAVALEEQVRLHPQDRRRLLLVVDEFQTLLGVDYAAMLSELRKFGGTFALATQALAHLDALDPTLRPTVLGNVDALYAFATSAEDARTLVRELDDAVEATDLINLDDFTCYAKLTLDGRRLSVFSLALDPPAHGELETAQRLQARARSRYARPVADIDEALLRAAERYTPPHEAHVAREARGGIERENALKGVPSSDASHADVDDGGLRAPSAPTSGDSPGGEVTPRGRGRRGWRRPSRPEIAAAGDLWAGLTSAADLPPAARDDRATGIRDYPPDEARATSVSDDSLSEPLTVEDTGDDDGDGEEEHDARGDMRGDI